MEAFHGMKKNTPPLLPVPSQSSSSSYGLSIHPTMNRQGTKRKRESLDWTMNSSLTMDEIMEGVRQIMKRFSKNSDQIDKGSRKKATIGIFGTSGEGKSSLLSAILGKKNLLPSGCFGACTAVVTQVEANLTDSNYIAEIELFSKEEWEKELKDLFSVLSDESEDRDDELYEIAVEKITALYGDDADEKTLEELKNDAKFAEIEYFLSTNKETFSKSDVNEFIDEVASYIQHSESSSGNWYWPLVKSVKIKIPDCRELLEHIVLVDIPGSGDCNKIRDDLWKSKLRECSSVWIISAINRASTDSGPWGILKHCTEELGPGGECKSINFICTKTDDIDPENYVRYTRLPRDQIPEDKDQKKVCILHRNKNGKTKVKEKFEKSKLKKIFSSDNQFQVFTVSSKAFFDPSLNLESSETEIPKLQDELRTLNKSMNRELVRDYVKVAKGTLLLIQSGQRDTDKKMMKMKVMELEKNLMKALNELDKYFDSIYSDLEQCLSKGVDESVKSCVASTTELITKKDGRGFHKILGALCKNYGCYWSKNWDEVLDLNKTLAKHLHTCIDEDFIKIFPVTETTGKSVQEQIDKFSIIQSDSANPSSPMHHIENFIKNEKETQLTPLLNRKIVDMKKLIYSSIQTTIRNEMTSCYKEAAAVTGTGSMKKKQDLLITTVDEIKHDMFNKAKMEVLKTLNTLKLLIMDALEKELKNAIERLQSQTSKIREDVSGYIEQLERLSDQLSD
ncbi:nuclear GTPase SLIP-GC-like isoform X2 [Ctenopharyngodon idella]|nr:nuclear GTPase SLIP-GC-like isoform X2 [Ctenopharyngodon idella]